MFIRGGPQQLCRGLGLCGEMSGNGLLMSDTPFGSCFGDPFRGLEQLSGRGFGGMDAWPPTRPSVQRVDVGRLLSESARQLLARAVQIAADRGAPDVDVLDLLAAATEEEPGRA